MIEREQTARFLRLEKAAPGLYSAFHGLTGAHTYFQGPGALRSISVSDVLDNGSIEATFQGVRIKFEPLLMLGSDRSPRLRVVCMQCHGSCSVPLQHTLGSFTYGEDRVTDLDPDVEGNFPRIDEQGAQIVLHFLEAAIHANRSSLA
jgi:hypothetical protein